MSYEDLGRLVFCNNNGDNKNLLRSVITNGCFDHLKQICSEYAIQMEHSYSRDCRPVEGSNGLTTRTLMVHRPPQCPSCHSHPIDEGIDLDEANHPPIPSYNESAAKESMTECTRIANSVRNLNSDDQDWEEHVNRNGWTSVQERLFTRIARILDLDHLARLATIGRQHEPIQRRVIIDKSVQRMRQVLSSVVWEPRLTQWIHGILMENLPPSYMASYLDILQTLKTKLPSLMDKMLFGRPMNINQELLTPVLKKQWDPIVSQKNRKLPGNAVIVIVPSTVGTTTLSSRMQKWYQLLSTMAQIVQVNAHGAGKSDGSGIQKQPIDQVAEHIVSTCRLKIQDLRNEQPTRQIILVGFNAAASLALQIALVENVNCVVCMGFAFNTVNGIRGAPDDHILEITTPIMFVIGQNSARSSQEEIESLREKMQSETSLVVVGSADDVLRVPKNKRQTEGVTQSMVDNMITDEIQEFIRNCIINPPGPRQPTSNINFANLHDATQSRTVGANVIAGRNVGIRKRKLSQGSDSEGVSSVKLKFDKYSGNRPGLIGRPRTRPIGNTPKQKILSQPSTEVLNMAIQSILPDGDRNTSSIKPEESEEENQMLSTYEIITQPKLEIRQTQALTQASLAGVGGSPLVMPMIQRTAATTSAQKVKVIPPNQFIHLKPPQPNTHKIYTIKASPMISGANTVAGGDSMRSLFTVKTTPSGAQYIQGAPQNQIAISPQKFTVIKSDSTVVGPGGDGTKGPSGDLSSANIFDMPILFADNEGNIHDTAPIGANAASITATSSPSQIIITQPQATDITQQGTKSFVISNTMQKAKANKVVFINRNNMKPCPNIISKAVPPLKYAKVVVTNPKTSTQSLVTRPTGPTDTDKPMTTVTIQKPKAIDLAPGTIVKTASNPIQQAGIVGGMTTVNKQFQPIIINVDSDKTTIKNMIKVGDTSQMKPTILLKSGGLKSIPVLKPGILNRNVTLRRVVNIVQGKPTNLTQNQLATTAAIASQSEPTRTVVTTSGGSHIVAVSSSNTTGTQ